MKDCLTTYTKKQFNTFEPDPEQLDIRDIAHALSMMTRANGHFPEFFSVAQHCIQCCNEALARNYGPEVALACLLHDGSEAYLADITRPVKKHMTMYKQIEAQLQEQIYMKFLDQLPEGELEEMVKNIDDACLYYEFKHFMDEELFTSEPVMVSTPDYTVMNMKDVEEEFIRLYEKLRSKLNV